MTKAGYQGVMSFLSDLFGNDTVNADKWFSVVESGRMTKVQEYINKDNTIVNRLDVKNQDALMIAAQKGHKEIVEVLIKAGADTSNHNFAGSTALMNAASCGHKDIVEILLKAGADVNQSRRGWTALMSAATNGHKDTVEVLIRAGADVNAYSLSGSTPLFCAVSKGDKDSVELLIKAGADFTKQNDKELTALRIAHNLGFKEIEDLLYKTCVDSNWEFKKPSTSDAVTISADGNTPGFKDYTVRSGDTRDKIKASLRSYPVHKQASLLNTHDNRVMGNQTSPGFNDQKFRQLENLFDPDFRGIEIVNAGSPPSDPNQYYVNIFSKFNIPKSIFEKMVTSINSLYSVPPGQFDLDDFMFTHMIAMRYGSKNGFLVDTEKIFHLYFNDEFGERVFVFIFKKIIYRPSAIIISLIFTLCHFRQDNWFRYREIFISLHRV
jgi:hypothetical protein